MIILLASTCGLRRGEAIALRWEGVELKARTLTVKQSYTRGEKGHIFQEPKTAAGIRTMAIPDVTMTALKKQKVLQAEDKLASGPKYNDHGLISQTKHGLPIVLIILKHVGLICLGGQDFPKSGSTICVTPMLHYY
jgi:integrase